MRSAKAPDGGNGTTRQKEVSVTFAKKRGLVGGGVSSEDALNTAENKFTSEHGRTSGILEKVGEGSRSMIGNRRTHLPRVPGGSK